VAWLTPIRDDSLMRDHPSSWRAALTTHAGSAFLPQSAKTGQGDGAE
jgi:hypothetical protein